MAKKKKNEAPKPIEQSGGEEEHREQPVAGAAATDDSRSLPESRVRVEDVELLRAVFEAAIRGIVPQVIEGLRDQLHVSEQAARPGALAPPNDDNAMARLLATTSDLRERLARIEVGMGETQRRVTLMEENQRPPAPAPDREAAARNAAFRWALANQCRASTFTRPTAAIVGRVMNDERAFDERTSKSPQELFLGILGTVRRVFRLAVPQRGQEAAAPRQDYVHLTEDMAAIFEERSSIPKKKHAEFLNDELKPRLKLLANSGLAHEVPNRVGKRINYSRFLTPMGHEVFDGWPDWADTTGGISLADEQMPPDPNAAGRLVIGATVPTESQPASPPPQPSPPPPPTGPPAT